AASARPAAPRGTCARRRHGRSAWWPKPRPAAAEAAHPMPDAAPSELHAEAPRHSRLRIGRDRIDRPRRVDHRTALRLGLGNGEEPIAQLRMEGGTHTLVTLLCL